MGSYERVLIYMFWVKEWNYLDVRVCIFFIFVCLVLMVLWYYGMWLRVHVWGFSLNNGKTENPSCASVFSQYPELWLALVDQIHRECLWKNYSSHYSSHYNRLTAGFLYWSSLLPFKMMNFLKFILYIMVR